MGSAFRLRSTATSDDASSETCFPAPLDHDARCYLLGIARAALEAAVLERADAQAASCPCPRLGRAGGAFVSLHREDGGLRGCVGLLRSESPLEATVARMAVAAGTEDRRFPPVRAEELIGLVIEISALSPLRRALPRELEVGRHGLLLRAAGSSGVLLPQVAVENGWDREEFLGRAAWKAGLPEDEWRRPHAEIYVFTAEVFAEPPGQFMRSGRPSS